MPLPPPLWLDRTYTVLGSAGEQSAEVLAGRLLGDHMTQDAGRLPDRDELGRAAYDAADRACRESNPLIASREAPWQELAEVTKEVWCRASIWPPRSATISDTSVSSRPSLTEPPSSPKPPLGGGLKGQALRGVGQRGRSETDATASSTVTADARSSDCRARAGSDCRATVWRAAGEAAAARALGCQGLALYIWEGVLSDYTDGLVVALAGSLEEAHAAVRAKAPTAATILFDRKDPWPPTKVLPVVSAEPEAWVVEGGG